MEGFSRDFLCGIGKGDAPPPEQRPGQLRDEMAEEVIELSLGLSLRGMFGIDKKGDKFPRSLSVKAVQMTPAEVPAPPALLRASGSPSSGSSEGDGQRLQGSGTLMRTSSLPAVIEAAGNEELKKRKSLKRLEVKKKRIERRNSLTCSTSKEVAGLIPEEMNAHTDKLASCDEAVVGNNENHGSGKHLAKGLLPKYQATITSSQDSLSAVGKKSNSAFKGTAVTEEHRSSSSVPSTRKATSSVMAASPLPSSSLTPRTAATLGSRGDQSILGRAAVLQGQTAWGDVERRIMHEMPGVFTKGLPNGKRVEGFLYKYREGEEVKIVCICHGSFLTPLEFVQHAGAGNGKVDNPLRHIVMSPTQTL